MTVLNIFIPTADVMVRFGIALHLSIPLRNVKEQQEVSNTGLFSTFIVLKSNCIFISDNLCAFKTASGD